MKCGEESGGAGELRSRGVKRLETRDWRLEIGDWRLSTCYSSLVMLPPLSGQRAENGG
jgi:hypothetical protein